MIQQTQQQHSPSSSSTKRAYYLVQKCWYDGPNVQPSQDYLALFDSQSTAEQWASHSAHLHASTSHSVVRTVLLQHPHTSYAFSAAGDLFWVRRVWVGQESSMMSPTYGSLADVALGGHGIVVGQVIGGTGNRSSRRGSEATEGVVFVGPESHQQALQTLQQQGPIQNKVIVWLPMFHQLNQDKLLDGWKAGGIVPQHNNTNVDATMDPMAMDSTMPLQTKRPVPGSNSNNNFQLLNNNNNNNNNHHHHHQTTANTDSATMMMMTATTSDAEIAQRPVKRRCGAAGVGFSASHLVANQLAANHRHHAAAATTAMETNKLQYSYCKKSYY